METISKESSLQYFDRSLKKAIERKRFQGSEELIIRVVYLLNNFIDPKALLDTKENQHLEREPLVLQYQKALESNTPGERFFNFTKIGDRALIIASAYEGWTHTRYQDKKYCIGIGEVAYGKAAIIASRKDNLKHTTRLYLELSDKFKPLVDVVTETLAPEVITFNKLLQNKR